MNGLTTSAQVHFCIYIAMESQSPHSSDRDSSTTAVYDLVFKRPEDLTFLSSAVERELSKSGILDSLSNPAQRDEIRHIVTSAVSILQYASMTREVQDELTFHESLLRVRIDPSDSADGSSSEPGASALRTGAVLDDILRTPEATASEAAPASAVSFDTMWV